MIRNTKHSCRPNCVALLEENETKINQINFLALKKIQVGEELTINYGFKKIPGKQIECLYGKKSS